MSTEAILMMLLAMAVLWGGLAVAIIKLNRSQPPTEEDIRLVETHRDL